MPRISLAIVLLLILVPALPAQDTAPRFEAADCPMNVPFGVDLRCGYVEVPESRTAPDSDRTIRIAVVVMESFSPTPAADPVIYLHGGPGGRALDSLEFLAYEFAPFAEERDVIFFDQRGVGFSGALDCPAFADMGYEILTQDLRLEELLDTVNAIFMACRDQHIANGVDLSAYTSVESAADLRDIVQALGYEQVNLLGISYGTRLGLTIMRDHPDILRSVILDAVLPLQVNPNAALAHNLQRAFDLLFSSCKADAACRENYPDLETVFYDAVARLNAEPELVSQFDRFTGQQRDVLLNGDSLIYGLFDLFYYTSELGRIPNYIYQAAEGDYQRFIDDIYYDLWDSDTFDEGLYMAVHCNEEMPFERNIGFDSAGLPAVINDLYAPDFDSTVTLCAAWGEAEINPADNAAVASDLPTLVMAGEYDPITPPAWAALAAETLSNSYLYTLPATGHATFASSNCASQMMLDFVTDPTQAPDSSCVAFVPPPLFALMDIESVDNLDYSSPRLNFDGIVPDGWFEYAPGLFSPYPQLASPLPVMAYRFPESLDQYVADIITNPEGVYRYDALPTAIEEVSANGLDWQVYQIEAQGIFAHFAMSEGDTRPYVIALISGDSATRDLLFADLLIPALQAFQPG